MYVKNRNLKKSLFNFLEGFVENIAHRGFSGKYPENTLIAFQKAIEIKADMIELDVTLSKDRIPIIIHDDTLERTTNGKGKIRNTSFKKLRELDAGSWKNIKFKNEKIPTLEEVLLLIKKRKIKLNIEIKTSAYDKKLSNSCIEKKTITLIQKYNLINRIVISSFEPKILLRLRKLSSKIKLALLIDPDFAKLKIDPIAFTKQIRGVSLNMHKSQINSSIFDNAKKQKFPIYIYTINSEKEILNAIDANISGIFTNFPDRLKEIESKV